jgi:hypothetical protein
MRTQNQTRLQPGVHEVPARSRRPIGRPGIWARFPELCTAVNAVGLAHSLEKSAEWVVRKRGGFADTWRSRHDQGCEIIARG